jgi:hypothetical protein
MSQGPLSRQQIKGLLKPMGSAIRMPISFPSGNGSFSLCFDELRSPRFCFLNVRSVRPRRKPPARHRERSGEAGGLVRIVERLNANNQDVKSRRMAGLIEIRLWRTKLETNSCPF